MHRKWRVSRTNQDFLNYLSDKASISKVVAQILVNRGMKDLDSIKDFLSPSLEDLHDPFLMPDMAKAVERLGHAIEEKETVLIHGDYDADGITSTALLVSSLKKLGLNTVYHIPARMVEGYGISEVGINKAKASGAGLIITADCGVTALKEVSYANSLGIDVIVTDHHEPPGKLPDALAVINPHRADSMYPYKYLSGVGVAFKFVHAVFKNYGQSIKGFACDDLLDLVALGTLADSVPLTGENRIIVTYGLKKINRSGCRPGIKALKEIAAVKGDIKSMQLSFTVIPRINAAGRIDDAGRAVELFLTDDPSQAADIAVILDKQNKERKNIEKAVLKSALEMIDPANPDSAIVLFSPDWHPGVIGIVASRLINRFYRPVFLFSEKDSIAKGSARGIPGFHLYDAIAECSEMLIAFGGHKQAAGLKMDLGMLPEFREKMNRIVERDLGAEGLIPSLEIDATVNLSDLNYNLIDELGLLEPYGMSNAEPVFGSKNTEIVNKRIVGNNHLKVMLKQDSVNIDAIGFGMGDQFGKMGTPPSLDIAFVPDINEWNGMRKLQLNLKGIRPGNRSGA